MPGDSSRWDAFVARHHLIWEKSRYELQFVELVLKRAPNLRPSLVSPQA